MMKDKSLDEFITATSSKNATPGGGSVAALLASLSISLASMSANLTIDKKGYEDVQGEMKNLVTIFENKSKIYLEYIEKDINAFNEVMSAYKLKKDTIEEKEYRSKVIQDKTMNALLVPYSLALDISSLLDNIKYCYYYCNNNVKSDALMAIIIARSAILSCLCNVYINLNSLKDESVKEEINYACLKMKNNVNELETELINHSPYFKM